MRISMAIACIWAWLVPHFYIEFSEYRLVLARSPAWNGTPNRQEEANLATMVGAGSAIFCILTLTVGSVLAIGWPTRGMDRRAEGIVEGLGRIMSAFLFAVFSLVIPKWLGVTYSSQRGTHYKEHACMSITARELSFRLCWSLLGHFFILYCILMLYFCDAGQGTVAMSSCIGIVCGLGVVWGVWFGRIQFRNRTRLLAVILSSTIAVSSALAFSAGCTYIKDVWYSEEDIISTREEYTVITFFVWLGLCAVFHLINFRLTRRKLKESMMDSTVCASSESGSANPDEAKKNWRYQSQVFQPPENIGFAATQLTKATAQAALATVRGSLSVLPSAESFCSATIRLMRTESPNVNRARANTGSSQISNISDEGLGLNPSQDDILTRYVGTCEPITVEEMEDQNSEASIGEGHSEERRDQSPGVEQSTLLNDLSETRSACPMPGDYNVGKKDTEIAVTDAESAIPHHGPSLWFMIESSSCCGRRKYYKAPPRKPWERAVNVAKWTLWGITSALHLYLTIINIGATVQQNAVRAALPATYAMFYPADYVTGTMCAWNESTPNADIRTFDSLDDVISANYTVVHCGACGNCSNWNDLSLQWTTRSYLAELGKECTQEGFFGTDEDVQNCNEELIGFTEDCAWCWTVDQKCASTKCVFIFLQSVIINQVSNFAVDPDDVTTATCDEALCGPQFIPCSGATRRRMNIKSDIPRPENQQCTVANEDWATIFGHP